MKTITINLIYKCEDFEEFMITMNKLGETINNIDDLFLKSCIVKEVKD